MPNAVNIDPNGGNLSWSIAVTHLKLAVYRGSLYDANMAPIEVWNDQNTIDNIPDTWAFNTVATNVQGCKFYWDAVVSDPSGQGGAYHLIVQILQNGNPISQIIVTGRSVPKGNGMVDWPGDYFIIS